ncbi:MAG: 3-oxo-tetronate kinase [Pseudomonadota bacterium]
MKIGVIADDFTGASDIALVLSEGGFSTVQYNGLPDSFAQSCIDAGVVALKTRTMEAAKAVEQSLAVAEWLLQQGCKQLVYKICSTFDSTAQGNIGPVTEALARRLDVSQVLVCPAYPDMQRTVYQGHVFVAGRLLSESGMQHHPLTPMTDSDIRRVMAHQSSWPVTHLPLNALRHHNHALRQLRLEHQPSHIVVDAVSNTDLLRIGRMAHDFPLVTGSAGIAHGVMPMFTVKGSSHQWHGVSGRGVVLCGSCSQMTRRQIAAYQQRYPSLEVNVEQLLQQSLAADELVDWAMSQPLDTPGLIYTSAAPQRVGQLQRQYGRSTVAGVIESLFSTVAGQLIGAGVKRIVVAGGETSGAVIEGTGVNQMVIGPCIATGVPAMHLPEAGVAIALKSGNFGDEDFFQTALQVLGGG